MLKQTVSCLAFAALAAVMTGCAVPAIPEQFDVAVSAAERQTAPLGSGPPALADSTWAGFRKPDPSQPTKTEPDAKGDIPTGPYGGLLNGGLLERPPVDAQIFIADFGARGQMVRIRENRYFLPALYGETIEVDGEWAPTEIPFSAFRTVSYGVQDDDRFGLAVMAQVRLARMYVGRAIIYAWGTISEDRLDGTFGYTLDFSDGLGGLVLESGGDQYPFYAVPVE